MLRFLEIPCIEAEVTDVIEVQRSPDPVTLMNGDASFAAHAYIGVIKRENRQAVYAGLHVREIQRSLIYTIEGALTTDAARKESEEFLTGMGFCLEPVSLKFSPAMREVILREIPVILPPAVAQKIHRAKERQIGEWRRLIDEPGPETPIDGPELSLAEWTQLKRKQEALAAAKKKAADQLAAEERMADKAVLLRRLIDEMQQQAKAGETAANDRDRLQALLVATQAAAAELQAKVDRLEAELAAKKNEHDILAQSKTVTGVLLAECRQQLVQAEQAREREAEGRKASELARKDAENRLRSLYAIAHKMKEQLAAVAPDREQLIQEKEAAERLVLQLRQEVLHAGARYQAEVARHQKTRGELLEKLAAAEDELRHHRLLRAQGETERKLTPALAAECRQEDKVMAWAADIPVPGEHIFPEQINSRPSEEKLLRAEIDRLLGEKSDLQMRLAERQILKTVPTLAANQKANSDPPAKTRNEPPPHVVRRPPPPDAFFQVDWNLAGVPYNSPEEIREIRKTVNRVRLSLEGYPDQYCSACLVIAETAGRKKVFIAFRLADSKRVLVYVPIKPADTPATFARAVKEAEKFLQVVGLDPEPVPLSENSGQRAKTLETVAFLDHPPQNAGNS